MPVSIDRIDITEGLVVFTAGKPPPAPNELPMLIHETFQCWLVQNPGLAIRNTLPIVVGEHSRIAGIATITKPDNPLDLTT